MLRSGMKTRMTTAVSIAWCFVCLGQAIDARTTVFTYQGKLTDGGSPATGSYDFTFTLFNVPSGGSPIGGDVVRDDVQVTNGIFAVELDFGASPFTSTTGHYLEIAVRAGASTGAYTTLIPRQSITSSPYSVQTIGATSAAVADDALQLGGVTASQFVKTGNPRLSDARTPAARSGNDIQDITTQRTSANFNIISRNGTVVSRGRTSPTFSGGGIPVGGVARRSDIPATFASRALPAGRRVPETSPPNSGLATLGGTAGIGRGSSGEYKVHVISASNLGLRVQTDALGGTVASFGGYGDFQIDAPGVVGGRFAVKESGKVGVGTNFPLATLDLQGGADSSGANDPQAMAFQWHGGGYRHWIRTRHNAVLGSGNAMDFFVNNETSAEGSTGPGLGSGSAHVMTLDSGRVGIGTANPTFKLHVVDPSNTGLRVQTDTAGGTIASFGGNGAFQIDAPNIVGGRLNITEAGNVGIGTTGPYGAKLSVNGGSGNGVSGNGDGIGVYGHSNSGWGVYGHSNSGTGVYSYSTNGAGVYGESGSDRGVHGHSNSGYGVYGHSNSSYAGYFQGNVYVTGTVTQNSDVRLKQGVRNLSHGLHEVMELRPVTWTWKQTSDGRVQIGLLAQEVEAVVPELVTTGLDAEQTKGINYIGLVPVVIKAIQEQQDTIITRNAEITTLRQQNAILDARLTALEQTLQQLLGQQQGQGHHRAARLHPD